MTHRDPTMTHPRDTTYDRAYRALLAAPHPLTVSQLAPLAGLAVDSSRSYRGLRRALAEGVELGHFVELPPRVPSGHGRPAARYDLTEGERYGWDEIAAEARGDFGAAP